MLIIIKNYININIISFFFCFFFFFFFYLVFCKCKNYFVAFILKYFVIKADIIRNTHTHTQNEEKHKKESKYEINCSKFFFFFLSINHIKKSISYNLVIVLALLHYYSSIFIHMWLLCNLWLCVWALSPNDPWIYVI